MRKPWSTFVYKTLSPELELSLDVFLPPNAIPAPASTFPPTFPPSPGSAKDPLKVLMWIHGGGLFISNREGIAPHVKLAAERHRICVVSIDYRIAPQANLAEILEDVRDAADWVRSTLQSRLPEGVFVDPVKLAIGGGSAGGYLALLSGHPTLGLSPPPKVIMTLYPISNPLGPFFSTPAKAVEGLQPGRTHIPAEDMVPYLDLSASVENGTIPPDFPPPAKHRAELYFWTIQEANWAETVMLKPSDHAIEEFTSQAFIGPSFPPVYVLHGVPDIQVGVEQSRELDALLTSRGVVHHQYDEIAAPDGAHLFDILDPNEEMVAMYAFMSKHLA